MVRLSNLRRKRRQLVEYLIREGVLKSENVIRAFLKVPREEFVLPEYRNSAYEDHPLPIPKGQTISAPHMCAMMCELLAIEKGCNILEIGTGSGYHAALCAEITSPTDSPTSGYVVSVEYFPELAEYAKNNLARTGYDDRVHLLVCDGSSSVPTSRRFDRILVTAAAPRIPSYLLELLNAPGRLVIPVGSTFYQILTLVEKDQEGNIREIKMGGCIFVPLLGKYGYRENTH